MEDVNLLFYLYHHYYPERCSAEEQDRIKELAEVFQLFDNHAHQGRLSLFVVSGGRWVEVPRLRDRESIIREYHHSLKHVAATGL